MKILILGGDGFIGSHLADQLFLNRHTICIVDKNNLRVSQSDYRYTFIKADLSTNTNQQLTDIIKETQPDLVFNCIAIANPHFYVKYPVETFNLDFVINYEICKVLGENKIPFMQFSTSEVYGKKWESVYEEETTDLTIGPTNKTRWIYATSKILLEQLILSHGWDCVIVRPQNFCGWDLDWLPDAKNNTSIKWKPRLPACILNSLIYNKDLYVILPGTQSRCYTDIQDATNGIISIVDHWVSCSNQVFNIGNPNNEISIQNFTFKMRSRWNDLAPEKYRHTKSIVNITGEDFYGAGYEDCVRRMFSLDKISSKTNWAPCIDIDQVIENIISNAIKNYL